jgi:hypothetical protein
MAAYLYVMRSSVTGQHHVGATSDLTGQVDSRRRVSSSDAPWECVYVEICNGLDEARTRVRHLESLEDREKGIRLLYTSRIASGPGRDGS